MSKTLSSEQDESTDSQLSEADIEALSAQATKASELLKAMSHEARLMILCLLLEGEKTVSEIEQSIGLAQATVSQHLSRLRMDRLIASRRDGRMIHYRIADDKVVALISTLHQQFCPPGMRPAQAETNR